MRRCDFSRLGDRDSIALRTIWKYISFLEYEENGSSDVDTLCRGHSNICLSDSRPTLLWWRITTRVEMLAPMTLNGSLKKVRSCSESNIDKPSNKAIRGYRYNLQQVPFSEFILVAHISLSVRTLCTWSRYECDIWEIVDRENGVEMPEIDTLLSFLVYNNFRFTGDAIIVQSSCKPFTVSP